MEFEENLSGSRRAAKKIQLHPKDSKMINYSNFCESLITPNSHIEGTPLKLKNSRKSKTECHPQTTWISIDSSSMKHSSELNNEKEISHSRKKENLINEEIYENLTNVSIDSFTNRMMGVGENNNTMRSKNEKTTERRKKTPKIEVRQEENKTVVKISVKETGTPEEEIEEEKFYENYYQNTKENPFTPIPMIGHEGYCENDGIVYENIDLTEDNCYENLIPETCIYSNLRINTKNQNQASTNKFKIEGKHSNFTNEVTFISKCDNEYTPEKDVKSVVKNIIEVSSKEPECLENNLYENLETNNCVSKEKKNVQRLEDNKPNFHETEENKICNKNSCILQLSKGKINSSQSVDTNSMGDPFDSGTSSDVDSVSPLVWIQKGNPSNKRGSPQEQRKEDAGHRRAESLTSSGVGIDSDDEKSSISCDSLNSNDQFLQSNSEDHGYHTPSAEDKMGSPIESIVCGNPAKELSKHFENCHKSESLKATCLTINLDRDDQANSLSNKSEPTGFEEYENVEMLPSISFSVKSSQNTAEVNQELKFTGFVENKNAENEQKNENQKCLPQNLLRDIQTRNVSLSRTDSKEIKPPIKNEKQWSLVEERTYEDRKSETQKGKTNAKSAMELDTDKFYKFHLSEKGDDEKGGRGGDEETFAGIKDYFSRDKSSAITSAKGTIRGVKNRVKAGIATFLQIQENKVGK